MKLLKWFALGVILTLLVIATTPVAIAQTPVTLKVYNPTGAFEVTQSFASRVSDLNGKTICEISNDSWQANRTFPAARELLQKQFPTAKIVPWDKFPKILTTSDIPNLEDEVKKAGCQAAIVGNAG